MNSATTAALSASHALAIGLGLVQQLAFAAVFGVTPAAGMFALAITAPVVTALIYTESLQVTLLPALVRAVDAGAEAAALSRSLVHAAVLGLAGGAVGLLWGSFVEWQTSIEWSVYVRFVLLLSLAHGVSMASSSMLVWLQADRALVLPSTVHLIPGALGTVAIIASADLTFVAVAYVGIGALQVAWLCSLSPTLRIALASIGRGGPRTAPQDALLPRLPLLALMIGSALPLLQLVDRLARGLIDLPAAAAASYGWAVTLGLAAVLGRGPSFAYSLFVAADDLVPRRQTFAFPVGLYALGMALGAAGWSAAPLARTMALGLWPEHGPLIDALAVVLPQLLLCLGPVAALPSLYRVLVRLSSVRAGARLVAWQFLGQVALAAVGLAQGGGALLDYSAAIAANLSYGGLLILALRLHAAATSNRASPP